MRKQEIIEAIEDKLEDLKLVDVEHQLTFDVLTNNELTPIQKVILSYMMMEPKEEWTQAIIWRDVCISNKATRQNLEKLTEMGYVKRGTRTGKWKLNVSI